MKNRKFVHPRPHPPPPPQEGISLKWCKTPVSKGNVPQQYDRVMLCNSKKNLCLSLSSVFRKTSTGSFIPWFLGKARQQVWTNAAQQTNWTAPISSYLLRISTTTSCLGLLPFIPLHALLRRLLIGVDIKLLLADRYWHLEELCGTSVLQNGEGGNWSVCGTQVVNVQAVPVASLLKVGGRGVGAGGG